ncbi:MAG TPA: SDR family oxidoreductase [Vicinamibacterales bacterium]|nr:SDR family oxidoreductase [Vicinamibacterales bacterium]
MRVFVTGATGFIGSVVVRELLDGGHEVVGLARSDAAAQALIDAGAQVHRGDVQDLDSLRRGAAAADGVIHTAFIHDFSKFQENCEIDRRAIEALGSALAGSDRLLLVTSGTGMVTVGRPATEQDAPASGPGAVPRVASEEAAAAVAARRVRVSVVRLPQVHDWKKQGLVTYAVEIAREKGLSAFVGDGTNRWPGVHRLDAARLYRLAFEKGTAGARYHAVAEEGVPMRDIAEVIGRRLGVPVVSRSPEDAAAHFGWLAHFVALDAPASSAWTQQTLDWRPAGPGLLFDLEQASNLDGRIETAGEAVSR